MELTANCHVLDEDVLILQRSVFSIKSNINIRTIGKYSRISMAKPILFEL